MSQSQYYVTHYFNAQNAGSFMAVSLIGLIEEISKDRSNDIYHFRYIDSGRNYHIL